MHWVGCDADGGREPGEATPLGQRDVSDGDPDGLRDDGCTIRITVLEERHELLAPQSYNRVRAAHRGAQPGCDSLQNQVAGGVTTAVVDPLAVVEVDQNLPSRAARARSRSPASRNQRLLYRRVRGSVMAALSSSA